jgi:putative ABC transport system ATP-binding protein
MDDPAVRARSLYRFFRSGDEEVLALQDVSLSVPAGHLVVVTGPSGSGKSTLLSCLAGLDEPDGGAVVIEGVRMSHRPEAARAALRARRIGVLMQSSNLFEHLTVQANLRLVQTLAPAPPEIRIQDLLDRVGLAGHADAYPGELSGGEAARAGLTVALAADPVVLLADEPTGELDSTAEADVLALLLAVAASGVAVIVASHSSAVAAAADRTLCLDGGRVVA